MPDNGSNGQALFVNLPVRDLEQSKAFFASLGFAFDERSSGETAASLIVNDETFIMLMSHESFASFAPKAITDTTEGNEVSLGLGAESEAAVDEMVRKAVAAGGSTYGEPMDSDHMYGHGFTDLDGHIWFFYFLHAG